MRRFIGFSLVIIGLLIAIPSSAEWYSGRTAVEELSAEDITLLQTAEATDAKTPEPADPIELAPKSIAPAIKNSPPPIYTSDADHTLGSSVATLLIPKIKQKYEVFWGADDDSLTKGVGMFVSDLTTVPGGNGHTVLSGHRDTVFTKLGELAAGDKLHVDYEGTRFTYEIADHWITHEEDRTVIVKKDESVLTLTTCYPFDFIGSAPDRYIVQAKLVSAQELKM